MSSEARAGGPDLPALPSECEGTVHHHLFFLLLLQGKEKFLAILNKYMEIHGTVYYESQRPPEVPAFVKNHGLLPQPEFQQLLRKAKVRLWPLSYPCRLQPWMEGIYQARQSPRALPPRILADTWSRRPGGPLLGGTRGVGSQVTRHGSKRL